MMISLLLAAQAAVATVERAPAQDDTARVQQRVEYRIEARLDEQDEELNGRLRMTYHNNVATRLDTLWFHLHLNAFRPDSRWAQRELEYGERRFQDLAADEHAYERVKRVVVNGTAVTPVYPLAPDSTVMGVPLPRPLAAGASAVVEMDWDARPSTLPRRQGRRGRHYDFAQWYPRIAVYDDGGWRVQPLMPQGEFFGEFGSYDVTLELREDQVVGATGVPVEGEPGWAAAAAVPGTQPDYRRDAYPATTARALGFLAGAAPAGAKRVRWRAEDVHHFAWTTNPAYIYEGGAYEDVAVHVLYQPGDSAWAGGVAVDRTEMALAQFDTIFGEFPWPQLTNVHRIEGGGTEFPMMVMDGSASEGLILHEVGHNYVHGILANNEWLEGWLDEGFVSYLTDWALSLIGRPVNWAASVSSVRGYERRGAVMPIATPSADFADPTMYSVMTYSKPAVVFRMLHWMVGDSTFRAALRRYYQDNRLSHVDEADLRAAFAAVHPEPLDWFWDQWLHTTGTLDYSLGPVTSTQDSTGQWVTTVEVRRDGDVFMPVDLRVGDVNLRLTSREPRQVVEIRSATRPGSVILDPDFVLLDRDATNQRGTPAN